MVGRLTEHGRKKEYQKCYNIPANINILIKKETRLNVKTTGQIYLAETWEEIKRINLDYKLEDKHSAFRAQINDER